MVASDSVDRMKSDPMLWRVDLDADAKKKLRDFVLACGKDPHAKEIMRVLTWSGFVASDNSQLVPIRQRGRRRWHRHGAVGGDRGFQYGQTATVLLMLVVSVSIIDLLSAQLRKRMI